MFTSRARAKSALLKAFNDETPRLRWLLIGCSVPDKDDDFIDAHIRLLASNSWVAVGLGRAHPDGGTPPWWPDGRSQVIEAIGRMKAKKSGPALLKVLMEKGSGKAYLGPYILPLLAEFQYKESIPELKRIIAADPSSLAPSLQPSSYVQVQAARVLWQLGDNSARLFLAPLLDGKSSGEKQLACRTIADFGTKEDIEALARRLDDEDFEIREAACRGLERITGVVNRAPGMTGSSENDAPLWKEWLEKRKKNLRK